MTSKVLLIEDDPNLGMLLKENFEGKGFVMDWCKDGQEGTDRFRSGTYDICIIDVMLPRKDGFTVAREIRGMNEQVPFIFLTAKSMSDDRHRGFELGADDYVTKPFSAYELYLRVKAILKRTGPPKEEVTEPVKLGRYEFDPGKRILRLDQEERKLSAKESELLHILQLNRNRLVNRSTILLKVWGNDDFFTSKSMDVYLTKLRRLLRDDPSLEIQNAYGAGFKLIEK